MDDLLIEGARLWTGGPLRTIHVAGGHIVSVTPEPDRRERSADVAAGTTTVRLDGRLVFPGFVNVHAHLDKAMLAARVPDETGTIDEVRRTMARAKSSFTHDDVRERAARTLDRCIRHGVTAVRTHVDVDPTVGLVSLRALAELKKEYEHAIDLQIVAFPQEGIEEFPGTEQLLRQALADGADLVGGHASIAAGTAELRRQVDMVFALAEEFDVDVDFHADFGITEDYGREVTRHRDGRDYPDNLGAVHIAERTVSAGYQGRVTVGHLCGLDMVAPALRANVCDLLRTAGVAVVSTPASNLYGNGRGDAVGARRGVTRLTELMAAGVDVAVGTDNIRDAFNPWGNTDLIQNAVIASLACHLVTEQDFMTMLELHTTAPAKIMGLAGYGLAAGDEASLVVLEARSLADLLDGDVARRLVLKRGRSVGPPPPAPLEVCGGPLPGVAP
ncbi:amidohydrolase family protein [Pseudonocardia sp.]|uniref:amidohydrolase family protein n=1 Tax=Pseudonocardia sp. TaxID=60912 RepID=UPI003D0EFFC4